MSRETLCCNGFMPFELLEWGLNAKAPATALTAPGCGKELVKESPA